MGNIRNCQGESQGLALPLLASELLFFSLKFKRNKQAVQVYMVKKNLLPA